MLRAVQRTARRRLAGLPNVEVDLIGSGHPRPGARIPAGVPDRLQEPRKVMQTSELLQRAAAIEFATRRGRARSPTAAWFTPTTAMEFVLPRATWSGLKLWRAAVLAAGRLDDRARWLPAAELGIHLVLQGRENKFRVRGRVGRDRANPSRRDRDASPRTCLRCGGAGWRPRSCRCVPGSAGPRPTT